MNYDKFCTILNKHIFEGEKKELLRKLAERPERFIGLFRPTKPGAKVLQHLLQSHEIRFGNAMEEIISEFLRDWKFDVLPEIIIPDIANPKKKLDIDQYFTDGKIYYFIEQKVRDDHDSSKKRGQKNNFEAKLEFLYKQHGEKLIGIMFFIDPDLIKNKNYYLEELDNMVKTYEINLYLLYGKELFEFFNKPDVWDNLLLWLTQWKEHLPELPDINFDNSPEDSFNEIKDLEIRFWREILENDELWKAGIMSSIFRNGETLKILFDFFSIKEEKVYIKLAEMIKQKLEKYYGEQ